MTRVRFRSQARMFNIGAVALAGLMLASCDNESPTTPTQPLPRPAPNNPPSVAIIRLEVKAPASIAPAETVKLTANALRSDGSIEDVTNRAQWSSADSDLVQVAAGGTAIGLRVGETTVVANYHDGNRTSYGSVSVVVLSPGTYKVSGRITDSGIAVPQVEVTAISGVGGGLTTLSRLDGSFALYGIAGRVHLQAKKEGFLDATKELDVSTILTQDFEMVPDRQRKDLSGNYSLTVEMGACDARSGPLPAEFRHRRYSATVSQDGPSLVVTLSGADFIIKDGRGNHFSGTLDPADNVILNLGNPDDLYLSEYADLVERVDARTAFLVYGTILAKATSTTIAGTLAGSLITADANAPSYWTGSGWCYSEGHLFEMRRQ
jgi:hypothetical protein